MKTLSELKTEYLAKHWTAAGDEVKHHLAAFVAWVEASVSNEPPRMPPTVSATPSTTDNPDPHAVAVTETKTYPSGTTVTGPGPLPDEDPASAAPASA